MIVQRDGLLERKEDRIQRLEKMVADFRRALFGQRSEKSPSGQYDLALEDIETAIAAIHAEDDSDQLAGPVVRVRKAQEPQHQPRCAAQASAAHRARDRAGQFGLRLRPRPARHRRGRVRTARHHPRPVPRHRHTPPEACMSVLQRRRHTGTRTGPADRGRHADGSNRRACAGVQVRRSPAALPVRPKSTAAGSSTLDRSTLAGWVGKAAYELRPVFDALIADLKRSTKLFMDETSAPVLDPGRGKTKSGYFWALARDDRPWNGDDPPGVAFTYAPGRSGQHADDILHDFGGILQVDGYAGYNRLLKRTGQETDRPIRLAYCWAHARRKLYEVARNSTAPIAEDGLRRIAELYAIEAGIRGSTAEVRLAIRQEQSAPKIADFEHWLQQQRARVSAKSPFGEALKYIARFWDGLILFLDDGRIEMDSNAVERTIRPIALNRKNALFAGHDAGAQNWAVIASLIETCKLNAVEPHAWLTKTLEAIVNGHPQRRINELLPWNYTATV